MASLQKTYTGDLTTAIAKRLLAAYFKYEDENYIAQGTPASSHPHCGRAGQGTGDAGARPARSSRPAKASSNRRWSGGGASAAWMMSRRLVAQQAVPGPGESAQCPSEWAK